MKRLLAIAALLSVSMLAARIVFEGSDSFTLKTGREHVPTQVGGTIEEMLKADQSGDLAVPEPVNEMKIAPVFDVTGAVVSDPTGTLSNANHLDDIAIPMTGAEIKIAPVFDHTGAVVSDPTGTLLNVNRLDDTVIPVTGAEMKIAPVFDHTGAITSDPTGTILGVIKP